MKNYSILRFNFICTPVYTERYHIFHNHVYYQFVYLTKIVCSTYDTKETICKYFCRVKSSVYHSVIILLELSYDLVKKYVL